MKKLALATSILFSLNASAALYDRGNGMIYDSTQNITWLQDSQYAKTTNYVPYGAMTWEQANIWTGNLTYGGFSDWRLTSAKLIGNSNFSYDGSTDQGYGNTRSEIGHLFSELGNMPTCDASGVCSSVGTGFLHASFVDSRTGLTVSFLNISFFNMYWQAERYAPESPYAWSFLPGGQQDYGKGQIGAWAVRDGDVAAVPIPAAAWLFGSGLIGLIGAARRKRNQA